MAFLSTTGAAGIRGAHTSFVQQLRERLAKWQEFRRTLDELRSLSDRDLRDLGLSRFAIRQIAYESVYGDR